MSLNESHVEEAALEWFRRRQGYAGQVGDPPSPRLRRTGLSYEVGHGAAFAKLRWAKPSLESGEPAAERDSFGVVVLVGRLRKAIPRLNPDFPRGGRPVVADVATTRTEMGPNP